MRFIFLFISSIFNFSDIRFRLKAALDEANEQLDIVRRENKNLADEVKDLLDQLGDGGRSIHELDKQRRRLEVRKLFFISKYFSLSISSVRLRRRSSRLLWRRPRALWRPRRTRCSAPSWSWDR